MTNTPQGTGKKRWFRRLLRVESFGAAYAYSLVALLSFIVWIFVDASFAHVAALYGGAFRLEHPLPLFPLSVRVSLFGMLSLIGLGEGVIVLGRLLIGKRGGRSLRSWLMATALVAGWLGLLVMHEELKWAGVRFRMQRRLPEFRLLAEHLKENWPTSDGTIPVVGRIKANGSPMIMKDISGMPLFTFPMTEPVDLMWREETGAIHINVGVMSEDNCMLEFLPSGKLPTSFEVIVDDVILHHPLRWYWQLDEDVYLAGYGAWKTRDERSSKRSAESPSP